MLRPTKICTGFISFLLHEGTVVQELARGTEYAKW
jgi:hypothetical protein